MAGEGLSILQSTFVIYIVLPFLLVFVVIFSILEKANILGEGKKYANILVAFVIAFIFIGVPKLVGVAVNIIPWISFMVIILLCLMILFGFIGVDITKNSGLKIALGITLAVALILAVLWAFGILKSVSKEAIQYVVLFAIFGGAIALVISSSNNKGTNKTD